VVRAGLPARDASPIRHLSARLTAGFGARREEALTIAAGVLAAAAALTWFTSLDGIDARKISDIGLISALPLTTLGAPVMLAAGFVLALNTKPIRQPLLALSVVLLVVMLHGITSMIQEVPRFATTYIHAGFGDAIMRTGELYVGRDARFSWPLFFVLGGYLTSIAGLDNPIQLTDWIPTLSNLLYLIPLWLIFRAVTADRRLIWLGLWMFVIGNWVGQDYYSPQGFNILLYLTIIAILLTWFRTDEKAPFSRIAASIRRLIRSPFAEGAAEAEPEPVTRLGSTARAGMVLVVVLIGGVVVASHQLTPFGLFAATAVVVATGQTVLRGYPILIGLLIGSWLSYMTLTYLAGHIQTLFAEALQAEAVATAAVSDRLRGNPGHLFVVFERIVFSAAFWGLAFLGGLRRLWHGHWDLMLALLAGFPFGFLALQSYGGEMLLRVYLFALPFMAFFVAGLFYPRIQPVSRLQPLLVVVLSGALIGGFFVARFGNDRADAMTRDEIVAVDRLHSVVPAGAVVAVGNHNSPLGYRDYETFVRLSLARDFVSFEAAQIADSFSELANGRPAFLFLSNSQRDFFDLNGFPADEWDALVEQMEASARFRLIFRTGDTVLLELVDGPTAVTP
jgi:hypothetical protein